MTAREIMLSNSGIALCILDAEYQENERQIRRAVRLLMATQARIEVLGERQAEIDDAKSKIRGMT